MVMAVSTNSRRMGEMFVIVTLVANARGIKDTQAYKEYGIGHNALVLALAIDVELRHAGVDTTHFVAMGKVHQMNIVPVGYELWPTDRMFAFACLFTKKVVNGGWSPDPKFRKMVEFVQELYNSSSMYDNDSLSTVVEAAYRKARTNYGLYL